MRKQSEALQRARWVALWTFGVASLVAIGLGAVAMALSDVPPGIWMRNPIAWVVAGALGLILVRQPWFRPMLAPIAVMAIALSLIGPGQEGVHRWLNLGSVQLNAAALVLPAAIGAFDRTRAVIAAPCFALIAGLLAWQPDVSQLAGFALATILLFTVRFGWPGALAAILVATATLALCLSRPDPLAPVAHVEGIVGLGWSVSPVLAIVMAISLAVAALSPLIVWSAHPLGITTPVPLAAYFAVTALAPAFGAYPVPLAGYGLSFVIGWWLGIVAEHPPRRLIP
jgi:hypothetical protein